MKLTSRLFSTRKIVLGAVSFLSLASIAAADAPYADANPFERSVFGDDWGVLSSDIFFGGAGAMFGLSPASRMLMLSTTSASKTSPDSNAIVDTASSSENLFNFASSLGSPFAIGARGPVSGGGGSVTAPNALLAIKQFDGGTSADTATGTSESWNSASGFSWRADGVPTSADDVIFDNAFRNPLQNVQLGGSGATRSANSVTIDLTTDQTWVLGASSGPTNATLALTTGNLTRTNTANTMLVTIGGVTGSGIGAGVMTLTTPAAGFTFTNLDTTGDLQINAIISGATKTVTTVGPGTTIFSAANTYSGATTISSGTLDAAATNSLGGTSGVTVNAGGTLLLSGAGTDRINNLAGIDLNGGTFNSNGVSEGTAGAAGAGMGALTLTLNSTIDFGTGSSILHFAGLGPHVPVAGADLAITNWSGSTGGGGTDRLLFTGDSSSFQLLFDQTDVSFNGVPGYNLVDFVGFYEVTAVPEPGTWIGAALALAALGFTQRKRFAKRLRVIIS